MARIVIADLPLLQDLTPEQLKELFGAGRFRPTFEQLEDRLVQSRMGMGIGVGADLFPVRDTKSLIQVIPAPTQVIQIMPQMGHSHSGDDFLGDDPVKAPHVGSNAATAAGAGQFEVPTPIMSRAGDAVKLPPLVNGAGQIELSPIAQKSMSLPAWIHTGNEIGPEQTTLDGVGRYRDYEAGTIYWSPQTGAHWVQNVILEKIPQPRAGTKGNFGNRSLNDLDNRRLTDFMGQRDQWLRTLGYPTNDTTVNADGSRFNTFERGTVSWSPGPGLQAPIELQAGTAPGGGVSVQDVKIENYPVRGKIFDRWHALGEEKHSHAIGPETVLLDGTLVQNFKLRPDGIHDQLIPGGITGGESTIVSSKYGAFEIAGAIRTKWLRLIKTDPGFGVPTDKEYATFDGHGRTQEFKMVNPVNDFPKKTISSSGHDNIGAHEVHGVIRQEWLKPGRDGEKFGYPISDEYRYVERAGAWWPFTADIISVSYFKNYETGQMWEIKIFNDKLTINPVSAEHESRVYQQIYERELPRNQGLVAQGLAAPGAAPALDPAGFGAAGMDVSGADPAARNAAFANLGAVENATLLPGTASHLSMADTAGTGSVQALSDGGLGLDGFGMKTSAAAAPLPQLPADAGMLPTPSTLPANVPADVVAPALLPEGSGMLPIASTMQMNLPADVVAGAQLPVGTTGAMATAQKLRAEKLISLFENGTQEIQYGYAEYLGDGRGITFGRAGFTTANGDGYEVVKEYTNRVRDNPLAQYLPRLAELAAQGPTNDIGGLDGFMAAVAQAGQDPVFRQVQDEMQDQLNFLPSVAHADALGLQTALGRAVLYDTVLMHGDGADPDGTAALIARTTEKMGGTPAGGIDEKAWIASFLEVRRADLLNASDPATRAEWAKATGRIDVFEAIADAGNWDLHGPIEVHTANYDFIITSDLASTPQLQADPTVLPTPSTLLPVDFGTLASDLVTRVSLSADPGMPPAPSPQTPADSGAATFNQVATLIPAADPGSAPQVQTDTVAVKLDQAV